jgi:hypothetical protein
MVPPKPGANEVTGLLRDWRQGDAAAASEVEREAARLGLTAIAARAHKLRPALGIR